MIILIIGLPNSGKTTLAKELAKRLPAVHWNADEVRESFGTVGKFTDADRLAQAKLMRFLCEKVKGDVIADFVCPTPETRAAFGEAFTIWVDRITSEQSRFEDTRALFVPPTEYAFRHTGETTTQEIYQCIIGVRNAHYISPAQHAHSHQH